jgi:hypothetical protein
LINFHIASKKIIAGERRRLGRTDQRGQFGIYN